MTTNMLERFFLLLPVFLAAAFYADGQVSVADYAKTATRNYYFDQGGDDRNAGSQESPYRSIGKLEDVPLGPGDTVFFKGGQTFRGTVRIQGADTGSSGRPLVVCSYGVGKATLYGDAVSAMRIDGTKHLVVRDLILAGAGRKAGNTENGLSVTDSRDVLIDSVDITGFRQAGLLVYQSADIRIVRVYAHENGFAGLSVTGSYKHHDCRNIYIGYCRASNNPGDPTNLQNHSGNGIIAGYCKNVLIEYCTASGNGWDMPRTGNGPVGIWAYEADSVVIQHCLSYRNKTSVGGGDGGGFDLDGGVTHSIVQYCLSYENQGSGFGIFQYSGASPWHDNVFRFNISEDDGNVSAAGAGVYVWNNSGDSAQFCDCWFYNNTIYNRNGAAIHFAGESMRKGFRFYNNIFVAGEKLVKGDPGDDRFEGNDGWRMNRKGNSDSGHSVSARAHRGMQKAGSVSAWEAALDPHFPNPGNASVLSAIGLATFRHYRLPPGSPLRTAGVDLKTEADMDRGGLDFNGGNSPQKGLGASF